jgi:hypothetical protein
MFQKAYNEVTKCKSTKLHGNGYLAKNPNRRQLLNAEREEKFIGKSYSMRNTSSSWTHLGSYKKKCQDGKKKGK